MLDRQLTRAVSIAGLLLAGCADHDARRAEGGTCPAWRPAGGDFGSVSTARPAVLVSPAAPSDGERLFAVGSWFDPDGERVGLLKSNDLGLSFCSLAMPAAPAAVAASPALRDLVYATTLPDDAGAVAALVSTDGGITWTAATPPPHAVLPAPPGYSGGALIASPSDPNLVWAVSSPTELAVTADGMQTWTDVPPPTVPSGAKISSFVQALIVDPGSPERALAEVLTVRPPDESAPYTNRLFTTEDAGVTWGEVFAQGVGDTSSGAPPPIVADAASTLFLAVSGELEQSTDWGQTWAEVGPLPETTVELVELRAPTAGRLFARGQADWLSDDGGVTWRMFSRPDASFVPWLLPNADADTVVGGVTSRIVVSRDGGETWRKGPAVPVPDVIVSSPVEPHPLWAPTLGLRSSDGGRSWSDAPLPFDAPGPAALLVDGASSDTVYALSNDGTSLWRSDDGAQNWAGVEFPLDLATLHRIVSCPPPDSCLYLLYADSTSRSAFATTLRRSDDQGRTWGEARAVPAAPFFYEPDGMVVVPGEPDHLLASGGEGLAESRDGGRSWTSEALPDGADVGSIAALKGGAVVVSSSSGSFKYGTLASSDGGATWTEVEPFGGTLTTFASRPDTVFLFAGDLYRSDDRGLTWSVVSPSWWRELGVTATAVAEAPGGKLVALLEDYGLVELE